MISHDDLWRGLEELARLQGCSISGLARRAGLDATTFNRSKRQNPQGKPRWPSTESLFRVLEATGTDLATFARLMSSMPMAAFDTTASGQTVLPLIDQDRACRDIPFDDEGMPVGQSWDLMPFPTSEDSDCFVIELTDQQAAPLYHIGDRLVLSPQGAQAQQARRGDHLAIGTIDGQMLLAELVRQSPRRLDLQALGSNHHQTLDRDQIRWMGRVIWVNR